MSEPEAVGLREEMLRFLRDSRSPYTVPLWEFVTKGGRQLASGKNGKVTIHRSLCREIFGEDV